MQGGTTKKKEPPKQALRDILGSYDPMTVSTPLDRNLAQIASAQPINLATMLNAPSQQVSIARDPLAQINLGKANTVRDIKPGKNVDEKIANYLSKKGKGGTTKKAEPAPTKDEPFLSDSVKRGLRDAGIILSGGVASLGEGIRGGNQMGANENILRNLGLAKEGDEQAILEDPNSPESAQARSLFSQLYGNRVKMPEKMTAAQFSAQSPVFDKILQRRLAEMRAQSGGKPASAPKISESAEKNLRLAKQLQSDYAKLAELQGKVGNETFDTPEKKAMGLLKNRIIESESVLSGQGALEQGIRDQKTGLLDVGTFENRKETADRNKGIGRNYYINEAKNLADQTGMDLDQDEKTGKLYLVDPQTGQRVRGL